MALTRITDTVLNSNKIGNLSGLQTINKGSLVDAVNENTAQLADTAKRTNKRYVQSARNRQNLRPLVTFIDDDGFDGVLTKLKPMFTSRGVPMGLALRGDAPVVVDPVKRAAIKDLQDNYGWEIQSHTMAHMDIELSTRQEVENDCKTFLETFNSYGFDVTSIVYPWGKIGDKYDIISKYFIAGYGTGNGYHTATSTPRDYNLYRYGLGSNMSAGMTTLAEFQGLVDTVKANNGWLILMTHCDYTDNDMQLITDVLDYVIAQGIEIVTPNEGFRTFGSLVQSGNPGTDGFNIKPHGVVVSDKYHMIKKPVDLTKLETDPPTTVNEIEVANVSGWSLGNGIVTTYNYAQGWQYQEFRKTGTSGLLYMRKWTGTAWKAWEQVITALPSLTFTLVSRTINANSVSEYTLYDSSLLSTDTHVAQPVGDIEAGLVWQCWSHGNGAMKIRIHNTTAAAITTTDRQWKIARFRI